MLTAPIVCAILAAASPQADFADGFLGVILVPREGGIAIVDFLPHSPAQHSGLEPNDVLDEINGQSITGWTFENVLETLRGPAGTSVTLGVARGIERERIVVVITRASAAPAWPDDAETQMLVTRFPALKTSDRLRAWIAERGIASWTYSQNDDDASRHNVVIEATDAQRIFAATVIEEVSERQVWQNLIAWWDFHIAVPREEAVGYVLGSESVGCTVQWAKPKVAIDPAAPPRVWWEIGVREEGGSVVTYGVDARATMRAGS